MKSCLRLLGIGYLSLVGKASQSYFSLKTSGSYSGLGGASLWAGGRVIEDDGVIKLLRCTSGGTLVIWFGGIN